MAEKNKVGYFGTKTDAESDDKHERVTEGLEILYRTSSSFSFSDDVSSPTQTDP